MRQTALQALRQLPTTTREDEAVLTALQAEAPTISRGHDNACKVLAVRWRMGYKRALARAHRLANACMQALAGSPHAAADS